jgi:hypothetical protein
VQVAALRRADHSSKESYQLSISVRLRNLIRGDQGPIWAAAPLDGWIGKIKNKNIRTDIRITNMLVILLNTTGAISEVVDPITKVRFHTRLTLTNNKKENRINGIFTIDIDVFDEVGETGPQICKTNEHTGFVQRHFKLFLSLIGEMLNYDIMTWVLENVNLCDSVQKFIRR